jgi:hypothetical protein
MLAVDEGLYVSIEQVFRDIGYARDCEPPARLVALVTKCVERAQQFVRPSYSYVVSNVESVHGSWVVLRDGVTFQSDVLAQLLTQAEKVAVFVLTIGSHLEDKANQMARDGLMLQATVLDAIGSQLTGRLAELVEDEIDDLARARGFNISRRFSPGYCDWDVSQQKMVFKVLKGSCAGIELTDSSLMVPRKSLSGVIGIGYGDVARYNPCPACDRYCCVGRRLA